MAVDGFFFTPLVLLFLPKRCHDEFFLKFNFFDGPCLKLAISKALGYGIVVGSAVVKVPQIIKVIQASSAEGLSLMSFFAELVATTGTAAYSILKNYPFSTWGEACFMSVQTSLLVILYYVYNKKTMAAGVFPIIYGILVYLLVSGRTPDHLVIQLFSLNVPFLIISKALQVIANFRQGHTGQLSFIMVLMLWLGSMARIFTTIQETGDTVMLVTYLCASSLNTILLLQVFYYWNVKVDTKKKTQ